MEEDRKIASGKTIVFMLILWSSQVLFSRKKERRGFS